jgi:hypothetical protein
MHHPATIDALLWQSRLTGPTTQPAGDAHRPKSAN